MLLNKPMQGQLNARVEAECGQGGASAILNYSATSRRDNLRRTNMGEHNG